MTGDHPDFAGFLVEQRIGSISLDPDALLTTCNTWTARALRSAGLPITSLYAVSAGNVMDQTRPLGKVLDR